MLTDKDISAGIERPGRALEARPFLKSLYEEIHSLERAATPETLAWLHRTSRKLSSTHRIPGARQAFGSAADAVFFEASARGPKRSVANVQEFISSVFMN